MLRFLLKIMILFVVLSGHIAMADPAVLFNDKGVALSGYDPVAYFTVKSPTKGQESISAKYQDVTYWFSSNENRSIFLAEPSKYVAQYGGYCAYAAALGKKAPGDPTQWSVIDNKLYLNYDARIQKQWLPNASASILKADALWDGIKNN
jgi:YHS domain-containing protein